MMQRFSARIDFMRIFSWLFLVAMFTAPLRAQQDSFRWMDFHAQQDQSIVTWATRSLDREKWTAVREIGVQYDAALVVTTLRPDAQSLPGEDTFTVWSVSLTSRTATPLLQGVNLRWLDWMRLVPEGAPELAAVYDDCAQCAVSTYFTVFHYDFSRHSWAARWMRGAQAVPLWSANTLAGIAQSEIYAALTEPNGRQIVATWTHFDYGATKPAEDYLYQYDLDPFSGLERMQILTGKSIDTMQQRLCNTQPGALTRGQDSPLCQPFVKQHSERRPVTTPPANNHGQSTPPGSRR